MFKLLSAGVCSLFLTVSLAGCGSFGQNAEQNSKETNPPKTEQTTPPKSNSNNGTSQESESTKKPKGDSIQTVSNPESIPVLVNKQNKLPDNYNPKDLVFTKVDFVGAPENSDKRKMRKEAADALQKLFDGAKKDGLTFLGVSAYRSHATQVALFNTYVKRDGYEKARTYSALPGTSEHETGLAIDVTGGDGRCAASDCFGGTKEAVWLEKHVAEYGFIIRYPKGKDSITGYQYEPWHIRYVGKEIATKIMSKGISLEEYYNATPVNK
ncbi:M15 family metallopeptidase [Neobacillus niacini]|uniref:M15 family metallopeptidase n=1 Tax=Neobacillus niacini TaxID=86668 RepID=UPI002864C7D0|nr:M15 family metallopeptidase [Neobacillus niacini]MDR6998862.1 D-alanyl-D-alanine carboxypeptidase [Neobacillus niacini]